MKPLRWLFAALALVSLALAVRFALHFPWAGTLDAIADADWLLLAAASVANIGSLLAKGWAWHLVLLPSAPHRWRTAQAATLVSAAVNSVSVSVSGEAARVQLVASRDGVPLRAGIWSLVCCRLIEALALMVFLAAVLAVIPTAPWVGYPASVPDCWRFCRHAGARRCSKPAARWRRGDWSRHWHCRS
jgi:hypothetical protein